MILRHPRHPLGLIALALVTIFSGCRKAEHRLAAADIHAITREFASAAGSASPPGSAVRTDLRASGAEPGSVDHLDVTIFAGSTANADPDVRPRLLRALGSIATRHRLTQSSPSESREGLLITYSHAGFATHTIHIHSSTSSAAREPTASPETQGPRLAIILDDLGNDRAAADAIFALPYPLTISVLPDQPHSADIAQEAHRRGYEVMLHLPMESIGGGHPETRELRPGMPAKEVSTLVNQFLQAVPGAAGVNNHQGSQSTADAPLMEELMPVLREHQLFYVDSRTTVATVAYDAAHRSGVRAAFRNVPFLDDVEEVAAVREQLRIALRGARDKGEAVAIGHPHSETLAALREVLPQAKSEGVRLVFASDLVR